MTYAFMLVVLIDFGKSWIVPEGVIPESEELVFKMGSEEDRVYFQTGQGDST